MELVSVIVPCYNQGIFLEECINSIKNQTYKNIEIIVVDDGSNDEETISILNKININYKNINLISIKNQGVCIARNVGISKSKGKYILPLDSDDLIDKTYIEKCVNILESNEDIGVVYCETELFGSQNGKFDLDKFSIQRILLSNVVVCTSMYRKSDYEKTKGYNPNMTYAYEDWDFWLSMIEIDKQFYKINEILFYYRKKDISRSTWLSLKHMKITIRQVYFNHKSLYDKYKITLEDLYTFHQISK